MRQRRLFGQVSNVKVACTKVKEDRLFGQVSYIKVWCIEVGEDRPFPQKIPKLGCIEEKEERPLGQAYYVKAGADPALRRWRAGSSTKPKDMRRRQILFQI